MCLWWQKTGERRSNGRSPFNNEACIQHGGVRDFVFAWGVIERRFLDPEAFLIRRFTCYDSRWSNISKILFFDYPEGIVIDEFVRSRIYNATKLDLVISRTEHVARNRPRNNVLLTLWLHC